MHGLVRDSASFVFVFLRDGRKTKTFIPTFTRHINHSSHCFSIGTTGRAGALAPTDSESERVAAVCLYTQQAGRSGYCKKQL